MRGVGFRLFGITQLAGFALAALAMLFWATAAQAQSTATDQYGSPTGPAAAVGDSLSVLPETGGAPVLLLVVGVVLVGTAMALFRRAGYWRA